MGGTRRSGGWLPDQETLDSWLEDLSQQVKGKDSLRHPVMQEFRRLIDSNAIVRMYLKQMIEVACRGRSEARADSTALSAGGES